MITKLIEKQRCQCLLLVLIICFWFGIFDFQSLLLGLLFLYFLSPFAVNPSEFDVKFAVPSGKYILQVRLNKLHEEQHNYSVSSPSVEKPSGTEESDGAEKKAVLHVEPDKVEAPTNSDASHTSPGDENSPLSTSRNIRQPAEHDTSVPAEEDEAARVQPDTTYELEDNQVQKVVKNPFIYHISDEGKRLDSRAVVPLTDLWWFEKEEDEEATWIAPPVGGGLVLKRLVKHEAISELDRSLSRLRVSRRRIQPTLISPPRVQQPTAVNTLAANGGAPVQRPRAGNSGATDDMDVDTKADEQVASGSTTAVQTSQQAGPSSAAEAEEGGMVGIKFHQQVVVESPAMDLEAMEIIRPSQQQPAADSSVVEDQAMDGSGLDQPAEDNVDEVMIGSDVEAAMEVDDDQAPSSSGDSSGSANADPMKLEEDGEAEDQDSMDIEPQSSSSSSSRVRVNMDKVQAGLRHERANLALRQSTSNEEVDRMETSEGDNIVPTSSQQQAAPPARLVATNRAADLREARRGKRAEGRSPSPPPPSRKRGCHDEDDEPSKRVRTGARALLDEQVAAPLNGFPDQTLTRKSCPFLNLGGVG